MAIDIIARGMIESSKNDISQLFDITKGGADVGGESSYTISNAVDYPLMGLNLYGKSTQDGTPTPENPIDIVSVGDSGSVAVQACGKNLVDYAKFKTKTDNGVSFINNNDGSITVSGKKTDITKNVFISYTLTHDESTRLFTPGTYSLSGIPSEYDNELYFYVNLFYGNSWHNQIGCSKVSNKKITFEIKSEYIEYDDYKVDIGIFNTKNFEVRTGTFYLQIEKGLTTTEFEPYKGNIASITSALPLCGIPVSEGGNYTDGNGQRWVCDELVYNADGTGKVVKRTMKIDSYNGESIATPYISTTGELTTGATVIYQLAEPQEIELTAAEMAALRELQTYSGITNISNGSSADMDVSYCTNKMLSKYVMPITTGLQAQIDELKAAVISLGGNV